MRKLGFTLAEVLITLGIIGVIATLTLPTLMTNVSEREYSTALKKGIGMFTEAIQINVAMENISFDEMTDDSSDLTDTESSSFVAFLNNRMQVEKITDQAGEMCAPGATAGTADCITYGGATSTAGMDAAVYFRDGSALFFKKSATSANCSEIADGYIGNVDAVKTYGDGDASSTYCLKGVFDTNGNKKPNLVANCSGNKSKTFLAEAIAEDTTTEETVAECTKDTFVARDQYPVVFTGVAAYPGSAAAQYIFNKK